MARLTLCALILFCFVIEARGQQVSGTVEAHPSGGIVCDIDWEFSEPNEDQGGSISIGVLLDPVTPHTIEDVHAFDSGNSGTVKIVCDHGRPLGSVNSMRVFYAGQGWGTVVFVGCAGTLQLPVDIDINGDDGEVITGAIAGLGSFPE